MHGEIVARHYLTREPLRVVWENGIVKLREAVDKVQGELWIAPPLIDLQVNGYGGIDFQQDALSTEDLLTATRQLQTAGCSHYLITLVTDDWSRMMARLKYLRNLRERSEILRKSIIGWHIEGPFLSPEPGFCGAHDPLKMCDPTPGYISELREIADEDRVLLTLAPERANALQAIAQAVSLGIRVSLGHTNASLEVLQKALAAGATGFTHLGNGCPGQLDRHDNILWRIFELNQLIVSLIPDKIHVSPALFRLVHRTLSPASIYYTTDAMAAAGAPPGRYTLGPSCVEVHEDQVVRMPGQSNYAGSALRPIQGVLRAAAMLGCGWQDVWRRFSEIPAGFIGFDLRLEAGHPARFLLMESPTPERINILRVVSG